MGMGMGMGMGGKPKPDVRMFFYNFPVLANRLFNDGFLRKMIRMMKTIIKIQRLLLNFSSMEENNSMNSKPKEIIFNWIEIWWRNSTKLW